MYYKRSEKVIKLIMRAMESWRLELSAGEQTLRETKSKEASSKETVAIIVRYSNNTTESYN